MRLIPFCTLGTALSMIGNASAFSPGAPSFGVGSANSIVGSGRIYSASKAPPFVHRSAATDVETASTDCEEDSEKSGEKSGLRPEFEAARDTVMTKIRATGKVPPKMDSFLDHFVAEYAQALQDSGAATPELCAKNVLSVLDFGIRYGMPNSPDHFTFETSHKAIREPFDYYAWGCDFFRPVMDLENSVVLGEENIKRAFDQVKKGENVVFLANHQSEADPQVFSILLESVGYGKEASEVTYVAGHKVTTDVLAVPFSMGRNLLCIHSKKHINADPETKSEKSRQNLKTMSAMSGMMKEGGCALWVAPSGGRDRRDVDTCEVPVAPFDQKTIDLFRLMANKSKTPTHFYPLAMVSYELCPPPDTTEATTGEDRNIRYSPIGIGVGEEVKNVGGVESRHLFTEHALEECERDYYQVLEAISEKVKESRKE